MLPVVLRARRDSRASDLGARQNDDHKNLLMKRLIAILFALTLVGGAVFVVVAAVKTVSLPSDAYASDWTAIFLIEHLKSNNDSWPDSWDELREEFDRMAEPGHYAWTFSELQERVDLQFDVTAEAVRDSDPPLVVFRLTSGRHV